MRSWPMPEGEGQEPDTMTTCHIVSFRDADGHLRFDRVPRPVYALGDALYFPRGLAERWQIRPLIQSDVPEGQTFRPGWHLLAKSYPALGGCYNAVKLPPDRQRNTRGNVLLALRQESRESPEFVELQAVLSARSEELRRKGA